LYLCRSIKVFSRFVAVIVREVVLVREVVFIWEVVLVPEVILVHVIIPGNMASRQLFGT
jgi:hypothetical protein